MMNAPLNVLICSVPLAGHVQPALPIARTLVERGHRVRWYTGREFRPAIEAVGATFEPLTRAIDPADVSLDDRFPERAGLTGLKGLKFDLEHFFLGEAPAHVTDVQEVLAAEPADVLLADTGFIAAGMLAELGGPPSVTYGVTALTIASRDTAPFGTALPPSSSILGRVRNRGLDMLARHVLFGRVQRRHQATRAQVGLSRTSKTIFDAAVSPYLYLHGSAEAFEYPRSDLPEQVRFIGPLLPPSPVDFAPPSWWSELDGSRPVVLVTQGTFATDADELIVPTLEALADEPVLVVVAGSTESLASVPANARAEAFIPFGALLPHVDVMISNGGFGGVQFALANGVPLVIGGATEDKPEIAARVAWSGAGVDLGTRSPTAVQVRTAVKRVLADPSFQANARRIRDAQPADAPALAADLIEELIRNRDLSSGSTGS